MELPADSASFAQLISSGTAIEDGEPLVGSAALFDAMMDFIVDTIGAFDMSLIGYISLKRDKGWLEQIQVKAK